MYFIIVLPHHSSLLESQLFYTVIISIFDNNKKRILSLF